MGVLTAMGVIATAINFAINPQDVIFMGFTIAIAVFNLSSRTSGVPTIFQEDKNHNDVRNLDFAAFCHCSWDNYRFLFYGRPTLTFAKVVVGWATLHAIGGLIGGALSWVLVNILIIREADNAVH